MQNAGALGPQMVPSPPGGFLPYKNDGVLVVPFMGLNLSIGTARVLKPKMTAVRVVTVPFRVFQVIDLKKRRKPQPYK